MCRACRTQYDDAASPCLLRLTALKRAAVSLCCVVIYTYVVNRRAHEESARTLVVLDVDGCTKSGGAVEQNILTKHLVSHAGTIIVEGLLRTAQ